MPKVFFVVFFCFFFPLRRLVTPWFSSGRHLSGDADEMMKGIPVFNDRTEFSEEATGLFFGYQSTATAEDELIRLNE